MIMLIQQFSNINLKNAKKFVLRISIVAMNYSKNFNLSNLKPFINNLISLKIKFFKIRNI